MWRIRRWIYRMGFRPKYGSIFFSPSRHHIHHGSPEGFIRGISQVTEEERKR